MSDEQSNRISHLSPSFLKQAKMCEARGFGRREEDDYREDRGEKASIGTLAHKVAEIWYGINPAWQAAVMASDPSVRPQAWVSQSWGGHDKHLAKSVDDAFGDAIREVAKRGDSPLEASSLMVARDMFLTMFSEIRRDLVNVVFTERRYKGELVNGVPVSLIIDMGIDRGNGKLEIVDWKTGTIMVPDKDLEDEDQVMMGLAAVRFDPMFASYPVIAFSYAWVQQAKMSREVCVPRETLEHYLASLAARFEYLRTIKEPQENINRFCGSCGRKHRCTKYRAFLGDAMGRDAPLGEEEIRAMPDAMLLEAMDRVTSQTKKLEDTRVMLRAMVLARLDARGGRPIASERLITKTRNTITTSIDPMTIMHLGHVYGVDVANLLSVRPNLAKAAFSKHSDAMLQIDATLSRCRSSPVLTVEAISVGEKVNPDTGTTLIPDDAMPASKKKRRVKKGDTVAAIPVGPGVPTMPDDNQNQISIDGDEPSDHP